MPIMYFSKTGKQASISKIWYFSDKSLSFCVAGKVPCLKNREQNIVAISKHLCGAATGKTSIPGSLWGWPPFWLSHHTPFRNALRVELKIPCELKETTRRAFPLWCTEIFTWVQIVGVEQLHEAVCFYEIINWTNWIGAVWFVQW